MSHLAGMVFNILSLSIIAIIKKNLQKHEEEISFQSLAIMQRIIDTK